MATAPVYAARPGSGHRHERHLPRLFLAWRGGAQALPDLRLAAYGRPSGTDAADHRASGLRRLLRLGGEARPAGAARPGGHRRRRQARRGHYLLLYRPAVRRALGHADVPGAPALPGRGDHPAGILQVPRRERPHHGQAEGPDAAGAAAVAGRGVGRSGRVRAPARRLAGRGADPPAGGDRARDRHHRLGGPRRQQVPGQDRLGPRQATRLFGDRGGRSSAPDPSPSCPASARPSPRGCTRRASPRSATWPAPSRKPWSSAGAPMACGSPNWRKAGMRGRSIRTRSARPSAPRPPSSTT